MGEQLGLQAGAVAGQGQARALLQVGPGQGQSQGQVADLGADRIGLCRHHRVGQSHLDRITMARGQQQAQAFGASQRRERHRPHAAGGRPDPAPRGDQHPRAAAGWPPLCQQPGLFQVVEDDQPADGLAPGPAHRRDFVGEVEPTLARQIEPAGAAGGGGDLAGD